MNLREQYEELYRSCLSEMAPRLESHLRGVLDGLPRIDRISARAKSVDRFVAKADKVLEDGSPKYGDPINEIQDQLGARVTVFYLFDVDTIKEAILNHFRAIEMLSKEPEGESEFGYFGEHFILLIPDDIKPDDPHPSCPEFFELQIKTLFQHAWSEADHDLGYKSVRELSKEEKRKVAFTAAQSWGADQIFRDLADKLVLGNSDGTRDRAND